VLESLDDIVEYVQTLGLVSGLVDSKYVYLAAAQVDILVTQAEKYALRNKIRIFTSNLLKT
jgi:hypothetical protein